MGSVPVSFEYLSPAPYVGDDHQLTRSKKLANTERTSTMSDPSGSSEDDGDYAFGDARMTESKRYPIHDCCEFEDADALRVSVGK